MQPNTKVLAGIALAMLLAACTTTDEIIIDKSGVNMSKYEADLAECQTYSQEVKTGEKAVRGATSGAVVGGLIGAAVGNSRDAQRGAGAGAVAARECTARNSRLRLRARGRSVARALRAARAARASRP